MMRIGQSILINSVHSTKNLITFQYLLVLASTRSCIIGFGTHVFYTIRTNYQGIEWNFWRRLVLHGQQKMPNGIDYMKNFCYFTKKANACAASSLAFFLFSFQVHEKQALLFITPALLTLDISVMFNLFFLHSTFFRPWIRCSRLSLTVASWYHRNSAPLWN